VVAFPSNFSPSVVDPAVLAEHLGQHLRIRIGFLLAAISLQLAVARGNHP
jgi:hypothetical protein